MSDQTLARLEGEVEAARAKLAANLATLTSPSTLNHLRTALTNEASAAKDQFVRSVQEGARSRVQEVIGALKAKAEANPVAVAVIGAGIAWRLMRHPPVTTALVGVGLYSLLNTDRHEPPFIQRHGLDEKAAALQKQASNLGAAASDMAERASDTLQGWSTWAQSAATELTSPATHRTDADVDRLSEVPRALRHSAERLDAHASHSETQIISGVGAAIAAEESRDRMLLGLAGLAVATALGIALQRREVEGSAA